MCADKTKKASVEKLNQYFKLEEDNGRTKCAVSKDLTRDMLGDEILCRLPLNHVIERLHSEVIFETNIWQYAEAYSNDEKITSPVSKDCRKCEFRVRENGKKSGFDECWKQAHGLTSDELEKAFVFDLWDPRGAAKHLKDNKIFLEDLIEDDLKVKPREGELGLSRSERQWVQVEKYQQKDQAEYFDTESLSLEINHIQPPLT